MIERIHLVHRKYLLVGLALISLILLTQGCASTGPKKPKRKSCLMCHKEEAAIFQQQAFQHASIAQGNCRDCHLSHGVSNKTVLVKEKADLCYTCHAEKQAEFEAGNVHYPVEKGDCTKCHDPHAAPNKEFLSKTGQSLCFSCHLEMETELSEAVNVHAPAKDGDCGACHDPHT